MTGPIRSFLQACDLPLWSPFESEESSLGILVSPEPHNEAFETLIDIEPVGRPSEVDKGIFEQRIILGNFGPALYFGGLGRSSNWLPIRAYRYSLRAGDRPPWGGPV